MQSPKYCTVLTLGYISAAIALKYLNILKNGNKFYDWGESNHISADDCAQKRCAIFIVGPPIPNSNIKWSCSYKDAKDVSEPEKGSDAWRDRKAKTKKLSGKLYRGKVCFFTQKTAGIWNIKAEIEKIKRVPEIDIEVLPGKPERVQYTVNIYGVETKKISKNKQIRLPQGTEISFEAFNVDEHGNCERIQNTDQIKIYYDKDETYTILR